MGRSAIHLIAICLVALATTGCGSTDKDSTSAPQWVIDASTGRYSEQSYVVGKGSARATGDPIADARAARDQARADLLSRVVVRVQSDFLSRISEYRVGSKWTETGETVSRIRTSVAATIPIQPEEELWTDKAASQVYVMLAVNRTLYAQSLAEDIQQMVEAHETELSRASRLARSGQSLEALRLINQIESTIPDYQIAGLSLRAVYPGATAPATPATPAALSSVRDAALAQCLMRVEASADGHDQSARESLGEVLRGLGMTVTDANARYSVRLVLDGETRQLALREGVPRVANGRYGWRLTVLPLHGGSDLSVVEDSASSPERAVSHSGPLAELERVRREAVGQAVAKACRVLEERLSGVD